VSPLRLLTIVRQVWVSKNDTHSSIKFATESLAFSEGVRLGISGQEVSKCLKDSLNARQARDMPFFHLSILQANWVICDNALIVASVSKTLRSFFFLQ